MFAANIRYAFAVKKVRDHLPTTPHVPSRNTIGRMFRAAWPTCPNLAPKCPATMGSSGILLWQTQAQDSGALATGGKVGQATGVFASASHWNAKYTPPEEADQNRHKPSTRSCFSCGARKPIACFLLPCRKFNLSGLMDNPLVGKKLKSKHPSNMGVAQN